MTYEMYFEIKCLCEEYYSKKKMEHAKAVESYVMKDTRYALMNTEDKYIARAAALAHDLLEDTNCTYDEINAISCTVAEITYLLTHFQEVSYYDYCKNIIDSKDVIAILVKTADIKDHLMRKKILSDKLKNKYAAVIPLFLAA